MSEIRTQALDEVRPGMELAEPVLDAGGQVLLPAGIALTEHLWTACAGAASTRYPSRRPPNRSTRPKSPASGSGYARG